MTGLNDRYLDAVLFAAYTVGSVAGLILVKSNMATAKTLLMTREWLAAPVFLSLAGAALYIGSFAIWLVILGRNELSVAYPIAIGLTLAFSTCTAGVMLGEVLTAWRIVASPSLPRDLDDCKVQSAAVRTEGVTAPTC